MEDMSSAAYYPPPPSSYYPPPASSTTTPPPPPHHYQEPPPPHHNYQDAPPPPHHLNYQDAPPPPHHYQEPLPPLHPHYQEPPPHHPHHNPYPYPQYQQEPPPPLNHHAYYHHPTYAPPPPPHDPAQDGVKTLFVAGLPDDVKVREIYNLFREFPGYQSSQLRSEFSRPFAFAVFADQNCALAAMHALHGMVFDLENKSTLFVEFAKSNSRTKRSRMDDEGAYSPDKRLRGAAPYSRGFSDSGVGSNIHMPGMGNSGYSTNVYPSAQSQPTYDQGSKGPDKLSNNVPCPTLFVANLGPAANQQELMEVFSRCPGFVNVKMQYLKGGPIAFVDFQDEGLATAARKHLQGTILHSSAGVGIRLEYAKARMGTKRRDRRN